MAKYQADVQTLLRAIGGRENIQAVSHCMTRMRFVLADPAKADTAAIEAIPAVKGTFTPGRTVFRSSSATMWPSSTMSLPPARVSRGSARMR